MLTLNSTAQDLDFRTGTAGVGSVDLDSQAITFEGGTGINTSHSGQDRNLCNRWRLQLITIH